MISLYIIELIAVLFVIFGVLFFQKENILAYICNIIGSIIYIYINYVVSFYSNVIINIYYIIINVYGLYSWNYYRKKNNNKLYKITFCNNNDYILTFILFIFSCILSFLMYYIIFNKFNINYLIDILIIGLSFSGIYQMIRKKVENWILWMIVNIISMIIYFYKGFILTGILFIILLLLSIQGFLLWRKKAVKSIFLIL